MSYLILVRHGQSIWNLEKKFTGWVDVDLTENGKLEAKKAGNLIKEKKIKIDLYYSSVQLRAKNTLKIIQEILQDTKFSKKVWQLNERHYGALTGLNKDEMKKKLGEDKVHQFRRSWDLQPEPLNKDNPYHPLNIETYKDVPINKIPDTESLKDTYERVLEFYKNEIENKINKNNILIISHIGLGMMLKGYKSTGANHPPRNKIEPNAHINKIFAYSPSQNIAYIIPEYSVW
jgi:2,3-bisphosphoglycerate-dependent phosphoglycerate mutase